MTTVEARKKAFIPLFVLLLGAGRGVCMLSMKGLVQEFLYASS